MFAAAPDVFVIVIANGQLRIPMSMLPKLTVEVERFTLAVLPADPVCVNATASGESDALSVIINEAAATPANVGEAVAQIVQYAPGAIAVPQVFD